MKFFQQLMLATVLFSFTIAGMSMHASKAHAGAQDGKFHLKCPRPAKWMLPDSTCIDKRTKKKEALRHTGLVRTQAAHQQRTYTLRQSHTAELILH